MFDPQSLLAEYSETIQGKTYVNAQILEKLSGQNIEKKSRFLSQYIKPLLLGMSLTENDVVKHVNVGTKRVLVAARIMNI